MTHVLRLIAAIAIAVPFSLQIESAKADEPCTKDGDGVVTSLSCWTDPLDLELVIYKLGLCTAAPTLPNLSECTFTFDNAGGTTINLGIGTQSALDGGDVRPPSGTYTHGVVVISNAFTVTAQKTFDRTMTGRTGTGNVCWSLAGAIDTESEDFTSRANYMVECGTSADASPAQMTDTLGSFGGPGPGFYPTASAVQSNGTIYATLTTQGLVQSTATSESERLVGVVEFTSPVEITDETTNLNAGFNVSTGTSLIDDDSINHLFAFGSGPFTVEVTAN